MSQGFTRGIPIDTDPNLSANSNFLVPSQAAVVAYIATHGGTGGGGNTIYTGNGALTSNRTVDLVSNNLTFSTLTGGYYYFTFTPSTGIIDTNFSINGVGSSSFFTNLSADNLTVTSSLVFNGGNSGSALVIGNGTDSANLSPGFLQLFPLSTLAQAALTTTGSGYVYVNNTSGNLIYRDTTGTDHDLLAAAGSMIWPTSNGLAYYNGGSVWQTSISTSAGLASVISDETGSGKLVFGTSPTITTSIATDTTGTFNLINSTASTINFAGDASTLNIVGNNSGTAQVNILGGPTSSGVYKNIYIGGGGLSGSLVNFIVGSSATDIAGSSSAFYSNVTVHGNFIVNGTQTTINSTTLQVTDKNIELGNAVAVSNVTGILSSTTTVTLTGAFTTSNMVPGQALTTVSGAGAFGAGARINNILNSTSFTTTVAHSSTGAITFNVGGPDNNTANGGGITLLDGSTGKKLFWEDGASLAQWTSTEDFNLQTGKKYRINNTEVLSSTTLGSGVVNSSLTKVGLSTAGIVKTDSSGNLSSGTVYLDDLSDVIITSPANRNVVIYDTTSPVAFKNRGLIGLDMQIGTAITVNVGTAGTTIGGYTTGDVVAATDTIYDIINKLLRKAIPPIYTAPSLAVTAAYSVGFEAGTLLTSSNNITTNWTFALNSGGTPYTWNSSTPTFGAGISYNFTGNTSTILATSTIIFSSYTVAAGATSYVISASVTYSDGPILNDSLGTPYPTGRILAGTTSNVARTITITGARYNFWGSFSTDYPAERIGGVIGNGTISSATGTTGTITLSSGSTANLVAGQSLTATSAGGNIGSGTTISTITSSTTFNITAASGITNGNITSIYTPNWIRSNLTITPTNINGLVIQMAVGSRSLIFAYPATTANITKFEQLTQSGQVFSDVTALLTNGTTPFIASVLVAGANGYVPIAYKVYKFSTVGTYTTATNFKITI